MSGDFSFHTAHVNGQTINYAACGDPAAPLMLFLHGFPEYWAGWAKVMPAFADTHYCVAPDQRGYNRSSKPEGVESYRAKHLAADMAALAEKISPGRNIILAGHDWGASVAYALAISMPQLVEKLVIVNGTHPGCFQDKLVNEPAQATASQYIHLLRSDRAEEVLSRDNFRTLKKLFVGFGDADILTDEEWDALVDVWSQPGELTATLNWYRASPLYVPEEGRPADPAKAPQLDPDRLKVTMPHLVVWGTGDTALLPVLLEDLPRYAPDLTIRKVDGAGHWILHEKPEEVIAAMKGFLG